MAAALIFVSLAVCQTPVCTARLRG